jgi:2-polyprenyl-3-methyl-5-hydroxy-6-metoxy-1,4-benzoquinol methylase
VEDSPWKAKQILSIINKNNLNPKSIAEIGCGAGEILHQLYMKMDNDVSFVGYEISQNAFDLCQQRKEDRLRFKMDGIFEETSSFDVIMVIDVFEHIEDYWGFLRNLSKMGNYKIFHIPLDISAQAVLRGSPFLRVRERVGHIHYFTKDTALATLRDTGHEIIDYFYTAGAVELSRRLLRTRLLRLPRKICYRINKDFAVRLLGGYSLMVLAK